MKSNISKEGTEFAKLAGLDLSTLVDAKEVVTGNIYDFFKSLDKDPQGEIFVIEKFKEIIYNSNGFLRLPVVKKEYLILQIEEQEEGIYLLSFKFGDEIIEKITIDQWWPKEVRGDNFELLFYCKGESIMTLRTPVKTKVWAFTTEEDVEVVK